MRHNVGLASVPMTLHSTLASLTNSFIEIKDLVSIRHQMVYVEIWWQWVFILVCMSSARILADTLRRTPPREFKPHARGRIVLFGNGGTINVMDSDWGSVSTVASRICCVVQRQISHCYMGQTPCGEELIGSNAVSAIISIVAKESWGITVDAFAHLRGWKLYGGYSITLVWE